MSVEFPAELRGLVAQVQGNVHSQPQQAIASARALLKLIERPEHLAYTYEQLGFAHLVLGEHRLSCLFYEQALALEPGNFYALAIMAHAQYELGSRETAVWTGRRAMRLKDEHACALASAGPSGTERPGVPHGGTLQLVSFSLYGSQPRYCEMAVLNVLAVRRHLPDFVCRFYMDDTVPPAIVERLQTLGAQCVPVRDRQAVVPPKFWRFWAMDDPQADCVLVRDADALIDAREAWCVSRWRESGAACHVIRDDCCHTELLLAGLIGVRAGAVRDVGARMLRHALEAGDAARGRYADQIFLRSLWPCLKQDMLTHDSIYAFGPGLQPLAYSPQDDEGPRNAFMGANHATCELTMSAAARADESVVPEVALKDSAGTLICSYPMTADPMNGAGGIVTWRITLPYIYLEPLQTGRWHCDIADHPLDARRPGEGCIDAAVLGFAAAATGR
jgi:hypothetical protein